ncbi:MAG: L-threonylcarbamoyladenylate synthase [Candidatus Methanomethylicia archaeon]
MNEKPLKNTLILKVDPENLEMDKITIAANVIRNGGLVAFPTETVYGLGVDALNAEAVKRMYMVKMRPLDNPTIVHVSRISDVYRLSVEVPDKAEELMKRFWPGPLTIVLKASEIVPRVTTGGLDTVGIRMPNHKVALALIDSSETPIAAPSANIAGRPSPTLAQHVIQDFYGKIDVILDAGPTRIGVESTVLDLTQTPPQILRPGGVTYEELKEVLGEVSIHPSVIAKIEVEYALSPGMKHKHYAPKAELIVVEGDLNKIVDKIIELTEEYSKFGLKIGILATDETMHRYGKGIVKSMGSRSDLKSAAKNLFKLLREFDDENVNLILAEGLPLKGLGLAIMNRLRRASGYNIIKVE